MLEMTNKINKKQDDTASVKVIDADLYQVYRLVNKKSVPYFIIPLEIVERNNIKTVLCKTIYLMNNIVSVNMMYHGSEYSLQAVNIEKDKEWLKLSTLFETQKKKKLDAAAQIAANVGVKKKRGRKKKEVIIVTDKKI